MVLSLMFITHFIADFLLQSREMGKKKSSEWAWLGKHLLIQFMCFLPFGIKFALLNTIVHGIIDKNIWNLYKYSAMVRLKKNPNHPLLSPDMTLPIVQRWQYQEDHWFYTTIGFDQLLHTLTIVILYGVL